MSPLLATLLLVPVQTDDWQKHEAPISKTSGR